MAFIGLMRECRGSLYVV